MSRYRAIGGMKIGRGNGSTAWAIAWPRVTMQFPLVPKTKYVEIYLDIPTQTKKFWEELIVYFFMIYGPHRKGHLQQFLFAAGAGLPSRCLVTIEGNTVRPTGSPLVRTAQKTRIQQFF
jgi:hypothetical protein